MTQKFEMSMMGELNYFLGFQVKQLKDDTFISQTKFTQDLLKRFGMKDAKPAKTPMGTDGHVDLNKGGKSVDQKAYRFMIGSLLYLCASRPDIMLSVCMCARFQSDPRELSHPVLEGKPNANYVRARIRTHVHSDYINEHHHTMLE
jgi:hypothetical protein